MPWKIGYVVLLLIAIIGCIGAVFTGAGVKLIEILLSQQTNELVVTATLPINSASATEPQSESTSKLGSQPVPQDTNQPQAIPATTGLPLMCSADKASGNPLSGLDEIIVGPGEQVHVEFYRYGGDPEREAVLSEGTYKLSQPLTGKYLRYNPACTVEDVTIQVEQHTLVRKTQGAVNADWADPEMVSQLFVKQ